MGGCHVFFSPKSGVGHQNFVPLRGGGSCFFEEPGFHFLLPTSPPVLFDQPLTIIPFLLIRTNLIRTLTLKSPKKNKNKLRTDWGWNWNLFRISFLIKILKSAKYHIVCICTIIFLPYRYSILSTYMLYTVHYSVVWDTICTMFTYTTKILLSIKSNRVKHLWQLLQIRTK